MKAQELKKLQETIMQGMQTCRERTLSGFGKAKSLESKGIGNRYSDALTEIDVGNQEDFLKSLYRDFPEVEISVEENTNTPTEIQKRFYSNDGRSQFLVTLDPVDGTYCYMNGLRLDYGLISSVLERTSPVEGRFVTGVIYYPSLDYFLLADEEGLLKITPNLRLRLRNQDVPKSTRKAYSVTPNTKNERLGYPKNAEIELVPDLLSYAQTVNQISLGEIPGFLANQGKLIDAGVVCYMSKQFGMDVEYFSGRLFGIVAFGDSIKDGVRDTRRDTYGPIIVGNKQDEQFQKYIQEYLKGSK